MALRRARAGRGCWFDDFARASVERDASELSRILAFEVKASERAPGSDFRGLTHRLTLDSSHSRDHPLRCAVDVAEVAPVRGDGVGALLMPPRVAPPPARLPPLSEPWSCRRSAWMPVASVPIALVPMRMESAFFLNRSNRPSLVSASCKAS